MTAKQQLQGPGEEALGWESASPLGDRCEQWQEGGEEGSTYIKGLSIEDSINVKIIMYLKQGRMWKGVGKVGRQVKESIFM